MTTDLDDLSDDELIHHFSKAAKEMGAAVLDSETGRANLKFQIMWDIDLVLRSRGREARLKLLTIA
jgi:hypothetical protein